MKIRFAALLFAGSVAFAASVGIALFVIRLLAGAVSATVGPMLHE